jgi:4-amino-4-deoxy-L-arabinose transferase-like glycosyltransferase
MSIDPNEPPRQDNPPDDAWRITVRLPSFRLPAFGSPQREPAPAEPGAPVDRRARAIEAAAFLLIAAIAVAVRVTKLGTIPRLITADEADNLQDAYHVLAGTGPGFIGFDWKPSPIFSIYQLAWTMRIFGDSVSDFRLFPVILSMLTIIGFYFLARRSMGPFAALAGMALLSTNLMFLHFSRTAWENANAAFFAVGACYVTQRALEQRNIDRRWAGWWALCGLFVTFGLYGYFTGRFIFVAVIIIVLAAIALRQAPWREALSGLVLAGLVSTILFAPMANKILNEWDYFNRRTENVSVFSISEEAPYEGDSNGWVIAAKNVVRNYQGLVLQDGGQVVRGLASRYNPHERAPLDFIATHLFWGGLIVGAIRWRKTYTWWPFFAPLFIAESFSTGTPDLARGVIFSPFYFLFIGLLFDEALKLARQPATRYAAGLSIAAVVAFVGTVNVVDYFEWQNLRSTQLSRMPGIDPCEFGVWRGLAKDAADAGPGLVDGEEFDRLRRELNCSDIVREAIGLPGGVEEEAPPEPPLDNGTVPDG